MPESVDMSISKKVWMEEPSSSIKMNKWCCEEKKRNDQWDKETEELECGKNQRNAQNKGFCCYAHALKMKEEKKEEKEKKKARIDGLNHCIFCNEDPCAFVQIKARLGENDDIYYDQEEYSKDPVACNRARQNRAYKYAAYILWDRLGYRRPHYKCVENGVCSLYPSP